ncbi:uncharacterized protein LOC136034975 [Artemia franciscana]|uniref:Ubiquitin-like domain-containing protein n=1 Tax=Artemia franciscana TaxID=6661 RepID=A0AA88LIE8_ARTSF|nr:hypothetical protein QYM36_003210 [Artemia franciscana]
MIPNRPAYTECNLKTTSPVVIEKTNKMIVPDRPIQRHYSDSSIAASAYDSNTTLNLSCNTTPLPRRRKRSSCDIQADQSSISSASSLNSIARANGGSFFAFLRKFKKRSENNRLRLPQETDRRQSNTSLNSVLSTTSTFAFFKPSPKDGPKMDKLKIKTKVIEDDYDDRLNPFVTSAESFEKAGHVHSLSKNPFEDVADDNFSTTSNFCATKHVPKTNDVSQIKSGAKYSLLESHEAKKDWPCLNYSLSNNTSEGKRIKHIKGKEMDGNPTKCESTSELRLFRVVAETPAHLMGERYIRSLPERRKKRKAPLPPKSFPQKCHMRSASLGSNESHKKRASHIPGKRRAPSPPNKEKNGSGSGSTAEYLTPPPSPAIPKSLNCSNTSASKVLESERHLYRNVIVPPVNGLSSKPKDSSQNSANNICDKNESSSSKSRVPPINTLNNLDTLKGGSVTPSSYNIQFENSGANAMIQDNATFNAKTFSSPMKLGESLVSQPPLPGGEKMTEIVLSDFSEVGKFSGNSNTNDEIPSIMKTSNELLALADGKLVPKSDRVKALVEAFNAQETRYHGKQWYKRSPKKASTLTRTKKKNDFEDDMIELPYFRSSVVRGRSTTSESMGEASNTEKRASTQISSLSPTRKFAFRRELEEGRRISLLNISELDKEAEAIIKKKRSLDSSRRYGFKYSDEPAIHTISEEASVRPLRFLTLEDFSVPSKSNVNSSSVNTRQNKKSEKFLAVLGNPKETKNISKDLKSINKTNMTNEKSKEVLNYASNIIASDNLLETKKRIVRKSPEKSSRDHSASQIMKTSKNIGTNENKYFKMLKEEVLSVNSPEPAHIKKEAVELNSLIGQPPSMLSSYSDNIHCKKAAEIKVKDPAPSQAISTPSDQLLKYTNAKDIKTDIKLDLDLYPPCSSREHKKSDKDDDNKKDPSENSGVLRINPLSKENYETSSTDTSSKMHKSRLELAALREKYFSAKLSTVPKKDVKCVKEESVKIKSKPCQGQFKTAKDSVAYSSPKSTMVEKKNPAVKILTTGEISSKISEGDKDDEKTAKKRLSDVTIDNIVGFITKAFQMNDFEKKASINIDSSTSQENSGNFSSLSASAALNKEKYDSEGSCGEHIVGQKSTDKYEQTNQHVPLKAQESHLAFLDIPDSDDGIPEHVLAIRSLDRIPSSKIADSNSVSNIKESQRSSSASQVYGNLKPVPLPRLSIQQKATLTSTKKESFDQQTDLEIFDSFKLSGIQDGMQSASNKIQNKEAKRPCPKPRIRIEKDKSTNLQDQSKNNRSDETPDNLRSFFTGNQLKPTSVTHVKVDHIEIIDDHSQKQEQLLDGSGQISKEHKSSNRTKSARSEENPSTSQSYIDKADFHFIDESEETVSSTPSSPKLYKNEEDIGNTASASRLVECTTKQSSSLEQDNRDPDNIKCTILVKNGREMKLNNLNLAPLSSPTLVSRAVSISPTSEMSLTHLQRKYSQEKSLSPRAQKKMKRSLHRIRINFFVEDAKSRRGPYLVSLMLETKVCDLKKKVEEELAIPIGNQKWFLGHELANDDARSVYSYIGDKETINTCFLYVVKGSPNGRRHAQVETTATVDRHLVKLMEGAIEPSSVKVMAKNAENKTSRALPADTKFKEDPSPKNLNDFYSNQCVPKTDIQRKESQLQIGLNKTLREVVVPENTHSSEFHSSGANLSKNIENVRGGDKTYVTSKSKSITEELNKTENEGLKGDDESKRMFQKDLIKTEDVKLHSPRMPEKLNILSVSPNSEKKCSVTTCHVNLNMTVMPEIISPCHNCKEELNQLDSKAAGDLNAKNENLECCSTVFPAIPTANLPLDLAKTTEPSFGNSSETEYILTEQLLLSSPKMQQYSIEISEIGKSHSSTLLNPESKSFREPKNVGQAGTLDKSQLGLNCCLRIEDETASSGTPVDITVPAESSCLQGSDLSRSSEQTNISNDPISISFSCLIDTVEAESVSNKKRDNFDSLDLKSQDRFKNQSFEDQPVIHQIPKECNQVRSPDFISKLPLKPLSISTRNIGVAENRTKCPEAIQKEKARYSELDVVRVTLISTKPSKGYHSICGNNSNVESNICGNEKPNQEFEEKKSKFLEPSLNQKYDSKNDNQQNSQQAVAKRSDEQSSDFTENLITDVVEKFALSKHSSTEYETASCEKDKLYEFISLDKRETVPNNEDNECPICFSEVEKGGGVVLRDCLHFFCRECLVQMVKQTAEPQVPCPYRDNTFACPSYLQDREVRGILNPEEFELYLQRSLELAAAVSSDSVRCNKENCHGWCICDTLDILTFNCPVCGSKNCVQCKAIHEGQTCEEYQEMKNIDENVLKNEKYLQQLQANGEGMPCPQCNAFLIKRKWGCDWIRCVACRTEICWITRGPRWGPGGKGDVSGGCRCGVGGVKCHRDCTYCH